MSSHFYDYTVRATTKEDWPLALEWTPRALDAKFWLQQGSGCESFLVSEKREERSLVSHPGITPVVYENYYPLAFFQIQHVGQGDQVRLQFQASPTASPKKLLRAITKLVPLIEKGLALRGVRAIFFTSHSSAMAEFMHKRLGYDYAGDGGMDGMMMAKALGIIHHRDTEAQRSATDQAL